MTNARRCRPDFDLLRERRTRHSVALPFFEIAKTDRASLEQLVELRNRD